MAYYLCSCFYLCVWNEYFMFDPLLLEVMGWLCLFDKGRVVGSSSYQWHYYISSRTEVFCEKSVPKNFFKFTGKHLCWSLRSEAQVFACEFYEVFKNTFFTKQLQTTAALIIYISQCRCFPCYHFHCWSCLKFCNCC